jgi:hypothetical protein
MNDHIPQAPKKPLVVYALQCVAFLTALSYALDAIVAFASFGDLSIMTVLRTATLAGLISGFSFAIWRGIGKRRTASRRFVLNYLWVMVLIYPAITILRSLNAYAPAPHLEDTELSGAALAEVTRYAIFLGLLIWVGLSAWLKRYLGSTAAPLPVVRTEPSWMTRDDP